MTFDCGTLLGRLRLFWYDLKKYGLATAIHNQKYIKKL